MLPWLVLPTAFAAARFRGAVVVADVALGIALLAAATSVDAAETAREPEGVLVAAVLMISITAIVFVLSAAEVEQRGEAVLDSLHRAPQPDVAAGSGGRVRASTRSRRRSST